MENNQQETAQTSATEPAVPTQPPQPPVPTPAKPGSKLPLVILIVAILLLGAALAFGGYYFGTHRSSPLSQTAGNQQPVFASQPLSATPSVSNPSPAATPSGPKKVSAGLTNQIFSAYTIDVPAGWTDSNTSNTASSTLTVSKDSYTLTISQAAGGAGGCVFPGDPPQPIAQTFTSMVGITGKTSQFRRGTSDNKTFTVCEKKNSTYSFPTSFGYITYAVPANPDQATLAAMDTMVASLSK